MAAPRLAPVPNSLRRPWPATALRVMLLPTTMLISAVLSSTSHASTVLSELHHNEDVQHDRLLGRRRGAFLTPVETPWPRLSSASYERGLVLLRQKQPAQRQQEQRPRGGSSTTTSARRAGLVHQERTLVQSTSGTPPVPAQAVRENFSRRAKIAHVRRILADELSPPPEKRYRCPYAMKNRKRLCFWPCCPYAHSGPERLTALGVAHMQPCPFYVRSGGSDCPLGTKCTMRHCDEDLEDILAPRQGSSSEDGEDPRVPVFSSTSSAAGSAESTFSLLHRPDRVDEEGYGGGASSSAPEEESPDADDANPDADSRAARGFGASPSKPIFLNTPSTRSRNSNQSSNDQQRRRQ